MVTRHLILATFLLGIATWPLNGEVWRFSDYKSAEALVVALPQEFRSESLAKHLSALFSVYQSLVGVAVDGGKFMVVASDGSKHVYDDQREKSDADLLEDADIEDMFQWVYPLKQVDTVPRGNDPGRARAEAMFQALYGSTAAIVTKDLVKVPFMGGTVRFNAKHGAAKALETVGKELEAEVVKNPDLKVYLTNLGGTFNWRPIGGTKRLSTHSFGIAIDLNVEKAKYWKWESADTLDSFSRKDFPNGIVRIFEKHGFVWGGKWYHYDTMHFEFRPEILALAREP